jgi:hypothetical protein
MPTLSQGHPCPQLFAKRHQISIGKDVCKDFLVKERKGKKDGKRKRKRKRVKYIQNSMIRGIDWFTNGIKKEIHEFSAIINTNSNVFPQTPFYSLCSLHLTSLFLKLSLATSLCYFCFLSALSFCSLLALSLNHLLLK